LHTDYFGLFEIKARKEPRIMARISTKSARIGNEVRFEESVPTMKSATPAGGRISSLFAGKKEITHDMIAKRAYEISASGRGGSELDNWLLAERELIGAY
jgi:hypothetical protein